MTPRKGLSRLSVSPLTTTRSERGAAWRGGRWAPRVEQWFVTELTDLKSPFPSFSVPPKRSLSSRHHLLPATCTCCDVLRDLALFNADLPACRTPLCRAVLCLCRHAVGQLRAEAGSGRLAGGVWLESDARVITNNNRHQTPVARRHLSGLPVAGKHHESVQ